jgi:hypothetical protein
MRMAVNVARRVASIVGSAKMLIEFDPFKILQPQRVRAGRYPRGAKTNPKAGRLNGGGSEYATAADGLSAIAPARFTKALAAGQEYKSEGPLETLGNKSLTTMGHPWAALCLHQCYGMIG